ncbi:hybrid sensor histidine kinase/response regulator [Anaeromyxobacter paludicola]|uniref:histidine kinase n=1 Tax=Anaeromyxobacter paludicola TaxID=2918171 RepID=A0ABM7X518_9BACT|nr:ATP-binding protein [Anaeromyxobacter paludicola]BDG06903.1 hypothetical protein AMPC_00160 [Anaeromyxobacter paludicola]
MSARPDDERFVVLAPSAHDGPVTARLLERAGLDCLLVRDMGELCRAIEGGAAGALVAEEALADTGVARLAALLSRQEPWSDLPVIVFTGQRESGAARQQELDDLARLGNVTLLARPLQVVTVLSAVRTALRARRRQYAARAVLSELQAVLDAVPAAVFISRDRDARRIEANRAASDALHLAPHANASLSAPPEERPRTFRAMRDGVELPVEQLPVQRAASTGAEVRNAEFDLVYADGALRHFFGNAAPLAGPDGQPIGAVGAFVDVTELKAAEERLRDSDRRKTEFLGVLSHELRNPLAPIRNSIYLLERAPPDSEQAGRARQVIQRQVAHLARLVDDLLDVTRISRGKIELRRALVDAREIVQRTCDDHRTLLEGRGVTLRVEASGPAWVEADATRLAQVLGNLLQNAAKFSPAGGTVTVAVQAEGGHARIRVRDDGIGIAPDLLPHVFEPFVQADDGLSRSHGGLGLGLALVKALVELHGGRVWAESGGLGLGTEFVIELPLAAAREAPAPAPGPAAARRSVHVLLIDDNQDAAETMGDILRLEGHRVDVASDGRSGLARARELSPDAIVCDIGLPDMDGYAVARTLRADEAFRGTRLIALTGYAQPEDRARAKAEGFDAHLSKPPPVEELLAQLSRPGRS